jgi:FMN-dependent oxidoreductase (nitrilotriacetate monooxygenase family)
MWRHPETVNGLLQPSYWEHIARTLEEGRFDAFFFADTLALYSDTIIERGGQMSMLDPVPLVAIMGRVTAHLGLGLTISTSFLPPYALARQLQTLDVLSGGRVAWNVVTSAVDREAQMFGLDKLPFRNERYDRAAEVLDLCMAQWKSWDADALVMDKANGRFIDRTKIECLDRTGKYVGMKGIFTVPPSPQGHPVIMQAGSSPRGRDFAAEWGEIVFTLQHTLSDMKAFYTDLKGRMEKFGRKQDDCAILVSVDPIVGETEEIARAKQVYINDFVDASLGIALASAHTGVDLTAFPIDRPISDMDLEAGARGSLDVILQGTLSENLTLGEAAKRFATSALCPQVVGTAESVADQLQEMFESKGCDGFILTPTQMPGSFEAFTRSVVPILQKRGLHRREYPGTTLRQTLIS